MTWNHRVIRRMFPDAAPSDQVQYGIHEVYYDPKRRPPSFTEDPMEVVGDSIEELRETLAHMLSCLDKPILDYDTGEEIPSE